VCAHVSVRACVCMTGFAGEPSGVCAVTFVPSDVGGGGVVVVGTRTGAITAVPGLDAIRPHSSLAAALTAKPVVVQGHSDGEVPQLCCCR
jgi:hypothetical protein